MTVPGLARSPENRLAQPAGFGRHTAPILWVLHGWLAMFFLGAAYAKLTEPRDILILLLGWPETVRPSVVEAVGWIELAIASALATPLLWNATWPRRIALAATMVVMTNAAVMLVFYALRLDPGLALTNAALILIGGGIFHGHRRTGLAAGRVRGDTSSPHGRDG